MKIQISKPSLLKLTSQKGQLVVEYVLLLVIATMVATMIRTFLVKRDSSGTPQGSGVLLHRWSEIGKAIGQDDPNKRSP
jgi:hypothetical protein